MISESRASSWITTSVANYCNSKITVVREKPLPSDTEDNISCLKTAAIFPPAIRLVQQHL